MYFSTAVSTSINSLQFYMSKKRKNACTPVKPGKTMRCKVLRKTYASNKHNTMQGKLLE